ncbi:MAG: LysR family transcriptional regulator [Azospirillum sp.]|nr:LysR family transcriptional regulator [Azospirillum sp.]
MDLKGLETLIWVAKLGGFRAAAERLNTTQPAISVRIAQLEEELGQRLFDRDNRKSSLTAKGLEFLEYAEKMIALRNEMLQAVADKTAFRGVVRVGVAETIVHTWLSRLLERVHYLYPSISLEIEVDISVNLSNRLIAHELEIAFLMGPVTAPYVKNQPLCSYPLEWVASPRLPLDWETPASLAALAHWPIITYARITKPHIAIREMFATAPNTTFPRIFGNSSLSTIIRMTTDGIGIASIPPVVIGRELAEGRLRIVKPEQHLAPLDFTVSYPSNPDNHLATAIATLARDIAKAGE